MRRIKTSLDWSAIETELKHESRNFPHYRDFSKLIVNVRLVVDRLSASEVLDRQHGGRKSVTTIDLIDEVNMQILAIEEAMTVVRLIS